MKSQAKSKWFKILCFGLAMIMVFSFLAPIATYAADNENYIITGEYSGNFDLKLSEDNIFKISEAAPGDKYEGKITIKNTGKDKMDVAVVDIASNIADTELYDGLKLKISNNNTVIYDGSYGKTPDPVTNYITINGNSETVFDIEVYFPEYSGNEFQGKEMDSTWTFEARYHNIEKVQTGQDLDSPNFMDTAYPLVIAFALMLICIAVSLIIYFKKREEEEEQI